MSQNPENSKVTIERNKGIFLIAAAIILSIALGGGLMKVGAGYSLVVLVAKGQFLP